MRIISYSRVIGTWELSYTVIAIHETLLEAKKKPVEIVRFGTFFYNTRRTGFRRHIYEDNSQHERIKGLISEKQF